MAKYDERITDLRVTVIDTCAGDGWVSQCLVVFVDDAGRRLEWRTDHLTWEGLWLQLGERVVINGFRYGDTVKRVRVTRVMVPN